MLICGCAKKDTGIIKLRISSWGDLPTRDAIMQLTKNYEQQHPDVKIAVEHLNYWGYWQKLPVEIAGRSAPDILMMVDDRFLYYASKGALVDLEPYIEKDKETFNINDYFPIAIEACSWNGHLYCLPKSFSLPVVMYYNKDLFDKEDVEYPKEGWTWSDFLNKAKKLTKDLDGDGKPDQWGVGFVPYYEQVWVWSNGGRVLDKDNKKCLLDTPASSGALQFLADLMYKHHVAPSPDEALAVGGKDYTLFETGKIGMTANGRWVVPEYRLWSKNFNWDVAPMPRSDTGKKANLLLVESFAISRQSKHKEEAWEFLKYACGPEGQKAFAELGGGVPASRSVANSEAFLGITPPVNNRVYLDELKYARLLPRTIKWGEIANALKQGFSRAWQGEEPFKEACQKVTPVVNSILKTE